MSSTTWLPRIGITLLGSITALGGLATPAQAASVGTASVVNGKLTFRAADGRVNQVRVTGIDDGNRTVIHDRVAIRPGRGCVQVPGDPAQVHCTGVTSVHVHLGDRNDTFVQQTLLGSYAYGGPGDDVLDGGNAWDVLRGGPGNDRVNGSNGKDILYGDSGNDVLTGGEERDHLHDGSGNDVVQGGRGHNVFYDGTGNDRFFGEGGDDTFIAGASAAYSDRFSGGSGIDQVSYQRRSKPVTFRPNMVADDGQAGEKDYVAGDVESRTGGRGDDTIYGAYFSGVLRGGPGDDKLYAGGGYDTLIGGPGRDLLSGGGGNDRLVGDPGTGKRYADVIIGGVDIDTVDYQGYRQPVTVDLDGRKSDDGVKGEKDTVGADVENIIGGSGSDRLTGNNADNVLDGGTAGADRLYGLGGDDTLLSDNRPAGVTDGQTDRLYGGAHVEGDFCSLDREDLAVGCERQ